MRAIPLPAGAVLLLLLAAAGAAENPPAIEPDAPVIFFENTTHDFGTIRSDRKVTYAWPFQNRGRSDLVITATRPSCGCTASVIDDKAVPPGGSGTLSVTFDPAGQHGKVRKSLAVVSNDPAHTVVSLTVRAEVEPVDRPPTPDGHPPITGQSLLMGSCASCHAAPAAGKRGEELWKAVCGMCHGAAAEGGLAPTLRAPDYLASKDDAALRTAIAYGTANPKMPGFSDQMGGPLRAEQIDSLVGLLRTWGPTATPPTAPGRTP